MPVNLLNFQLVQVQNLYTEYLHFLSKDSYSIKYQISYILSDAGKNQALSTLGDTCHLNNMSNTQCRTVLYITDNNTYGPNLGRYHD